MKKSSVCALVVAIGLVGGLCTLKCTERIPSGYAGVKYSMNGGVKDDVLDEGWHIVSPMVKIKEFTISNEQLILSKDKREGSKDDESFKVATSDDASIAVSFQMSYRYMPEKVVETYKKFKGMDGESIVNNRVKTVLKSKISEITTNYSMMDIYSGNRSEINNKITEKLNEEFKKSYGIEVLDASIIDVHPDKQLAKAIEDRVKALQKRQQAEAEQESIKVQKETEKLQAQADAEIEITKANAKAEKTRIQAEAEAEANRVISESLTDKLLKKMENEARLKHGWVEIQGADAVVTTK